MSMISAALILALGVQDQVARLDADPARYWSGPGGWAVYSYPEEKMCDIGFPTDSGNYVTVGFTPREGRVNLLVTNRHATSLRVGEVRRLLVGFEDTPSGRFTDARMLNFEVVDAGGRPSLAAADSWAGFLDSFGRFGVMGVLTPDRRVVIAIMLRGSGEAVRQLRSCAMQAAGLDPRDPFLPAR